jgi:Ca2+-binding RTX toxin-like protein
MSGSRVVRRTLGSLILGLSLLEANALAANAATCIGTSGPDELFCSSGDDFMDGLGGNDDMFADSGYDEMHGSGGADFMNGELGNDNMYGTAGNDIVIGASGNDDLHDTNASDDDYMCGLAGTSDEIWVNDGDPDDIIWDGGSGTHHTDAGDSINLSETSCP